MKRSIALALFFAAGVAGAVSPRKPADVFGWQLDCATTMALNAYDPGMSETNRVRRAVDRCMSGSLSGGGSLVRTSANVTLMMLEERRENLVEAVRQRLELCRNIGFRAAQLAKDCPRLFTLEEVTHD